jgi:hypothetical protein
MANVLYPVAKKPCPRCGAMIENERVLIGKKAHAVNGPINVLLHVDKFNSMCDDGWQPIHTHMPYPQMVSLADSQK